MSLRPYQKAGLELIYSKLKQGINRQLVKWPTGTGKTVLFSNLPSTLEMRGRMLVVVHREELATQAADKIRKWNPGRSVGREMADVRSSGEQIVVAGVQTIGSKNSKRLQQFRPEDFEAVVVDEAHHATASTYRNIIKHFRVYEDPNRLLLGVTATPNRADGQGLGEVFEEIVHDFSILEAINHGWLANIRAVSIRTKANLDLVKTLAGEFNLGELGKTVNDIARNDLIVREWLAKAENRQTVLFAVDVNHAQALAAMFKHYGVSAEAIWGDDPNRSLKLQMHQEGHIKVLCNCQILTEGYDDWRVACIVQARPTKSESLYTQMVGRGTRIPENIDNLVAALARGEVVAKRDCLILDFVDNTTTHSLVTLPTLFGLGVGIDLEGKTITEAMEVFKRVKASKPLLDLSKASKISKLESYAEEVDLFKVVYAPEVIQYSDYQWIKTGPSAYVLLLLNGDHMVALTDVLGKWHVSGICNDEQIYDTFNDLKAAITWGDSKVRALSSSKEVSLFKRDAPWHSLPANEGQVRLAQRLGIRIPQGKISKGDLSKKINEVLALRRLKSNERIRQRLVG